MSTNSQPSATGTVLRRKKDGSRVPVPCPESVILYMGAVDHSDQLCGYYSCRTKSRKFYKYIYHFLFDVTITSFCIRISISTQGTRQSGNSVYSWPGSSLGTTVVGDDLDVVVVRLSLYNCNTFQPQLQASQVHGRQREGVVLNVHETTSVPTHSGSVVCGCVTMVTPQTIIENISNNNLSVHVYQESQP